MLKPVPYFLMAIFLTSLLTSCFIDNKSESYFFEGDIRTLLIQETEVSSGWRFSRSFSAPPTEDMIANLGVVYASRHTVNQRATLINHYVVAYKQQEVTIKHLEFSNEEYFNPIIEPPQKYRYRSSLADKFEIICTSINSNLDGLFIGYHCLYSARYGNAISELTVDIEREDGVKTEEANLLSWAEVERLLKLIDEKFEKVGFAEE